MLDEPLDPVSASRLARDILENGTVSYTGHARREMAKDGLSEADIERALRSGTEPAEWEGGQWRYRFFCADVWAVVSFRNEQLLVTITAWRKRR